MEYRELPRTGWKVSVISYGCMSLRTGHGAESRELKDLRSQVSELRSEISDLRSGSTERLLHQAVDLGINFFDTADLYDKGQNEIVVGKGLRAKRGEIYIATKVGNQLRPDGSGWDWNPCKEYILEAVDESLKRLQTDYIDLYQLHGGTIEDPIDEVIEAFELLKEQGKIRAYGISSIRPNVIREYVARSNIASVMMQYSLLDRRPEETCLPLLQEHGIGVLVRGAVAKGLLVDKPAMEYLGYSLEQTASARALVARISSSGSWGMKDQGAGTIDALPASRLEGPESKDDGLGNSKRQRETDNRQPARTPAQIALQFALKGPAIYSVAAGMRTEEQLVENAGAPEAGALSDEDYRTLQSALDPKLYEGHR